MRVAVDETAAALPSVGTKRTRACADLVVARGQGGFSRHQELSCGFSTTMKASSVDRSQRGGVQRAEGTKRASPRRRLSAKHTRHRGEMPFPLRWDNEPEMSSRMAHSRFTLGFVLPRRE